MINEVDEALRNLVRDEVVNGADVDVLFDAPTREWAARRNTPTVDLYLYDIREDLQRRQTGLTDVRDDQGRVVERREAPRFFKMAYLITAWTQRPEDEHRLLSALLACFVRHAIVPETALTPLLRDLLLQDLQSPLYITIAYPPSENRQVSDVWTSLGGDLKPSLDLVITMALPAEVLTEIASAVMAPLRVKASGHTTYDVQDDVRHLRDPGGGNGAAAAPPAAAPAPAEPAGTTQVTTRRRRASGS